MRDKQSILRAAEKYVLEQKFSAAVAEYRKLLELEPDEPTLLNIVGDLLVRQGKPQEALKQFQKVVDLFLNRGFAPKAIAMLKKIVWVSPEDFRARETLADLYGKQGLQFDAMREYQGLVDHYIEAGDIDRALHFLRRLGSISPDDPEVYLKRGELLTGQGKAEAALKEQVAALECLRKNGDFERFKPTFREVLRADPANAPALEQLIKAGEGSHAQEEVRDILSRHLESGAPDYPVKLFLARAEEQLSNLDAAAKLYKELRQAGHADQAITEGLLRTDPESAYVSSDSAALFEESGFPSLESEPNQIDWSAGEGAETTKASGSGLFGDFEAEVEEFSPEPGEETFSFSEAEPTLEDSAQEKEELSLELEKAQEAEIPEVQPIASLDEALQEVDFYLKLGFKDDAIHLLRRLLRQFPQEESVQVRARKVELDIPEAEASQPAAKSSESASPEEEAAAESANFLGSDLFANFESEMESALDDLFVEGSNGDSEGSILRYDVTDGSVDQADSPKVHYDLGLAYKEMGLVDDALQEFLIAMDMLDGESSVPQRILCCSMLTNTCRQLGKNEEAIHWAREGLKIDQLKDFERRSLEYDLGLALGEQGELEEAIAVLQSIQEQDSSYRDVREKLGHFKSRLHG